MRAGESVAYRESPGQTGGVGRAVLFLLLVLSLFLTFMHLFSRRDLEAVPKDSHVATICNNHMIIPQCFLTDHRELFLT